MMGTTQLSDTTQDKLDEIAEEVNPYQAVEGVIELFEEDEYAWKDGIRFTQKIQIDAYQPQIELSDTVEETLLQRTGNGPVLVDTEYGRYVITHERESDVGSSPDSASATKDYLTFQKVEDELSG